MYLLVLYSSNCFLLRNSNQIRNRKVHVHVVRKKKIKSFIAKYRLNSWKWHFIPFTFKFLMKIGCNISLIPMSNCWKDSSPSSGKSSINFGEIQWAIGLPAISRIRIILKKLIMMFFLNRLHDIVFNMLQIKNRIRKTIFIVFIKKRWGELYFLAKFPPPYNSFSEICQHCFWIFLYFNVYRTFSVFVKKKQRFKMELSHLFDYLKDGEYP